MFIRISNSGGRKYLRLVQAYRDENGVPRQRQVAQLGRLDELDEPMVNGLIDSLRRFTGFGGSSEPAEGVEPAFERAREVGPTWLLSELWQSLGFSALLRTALRSSRREFDAEAAIRLMVFNRVCDPDSKLGVLRWLEGVVMPGISGEVFTHQRLLRAMDALMDKREAIQRALSKRLLPLLDQELSVVFYDLTTIRVHAEHERPQDLRRFGRSKELHGPARQFVLGLIQSADGIPLDFEVFPGNIAEVKTLLPMLERTLKRYPIERVIVVADRGLLSLDNLAEVEQLTVQGGRALEYILAVPANRYGDFEAVLEPLRFAQDVHSVREGQWQNRRVVIANDPERGKEQQQRRQDKLNTLSELGERLAAKLDAQDEGKSERGRRASDRGAYARFSRAVHDAHFSRFITPVLDTDRFSFAINESALADAQRLDGKLILVTNVTDHAPEDIVLRYKALADIERGFRVLKS
ncbi:MAG: IS1634 family transposase, partial [Gammaproteobacteria bacterium]|nr:IS1634 family transposase [Gammaproteobacteria bacterium]